MASGTSGSISRGQVIDFPTSSPLKGIAIKKQTLIAGIVLLTIFMALAIEFGVHANGQAGGSTNSNGQATNSQDPKTPASASNTPSNSATPGTSESGSSVNIQYNSSTTTSSNPANNSSSSSLTVNGQQVPTEDGNVNEHYTSADGSTKVNISGNSSSSVGGQSQ